MDDIAESYITRFISRLKVRMVKVFEVFNIELGMPLILNSKRCKKLLGIANEAEFQRVTHLKDFPRIEKKGSHPRFPRDAVVEWMKENWRLL
ncbi:TPA: DNA-binding protein [Streptococcus suis]|nr:DNA-binding protein [Streptococcus suis]